MYNFSIFLMSKNFDNLDLYFPVKCRSKIKSENEYAKYTGKKAILYKFQMASKFHNGAGYIYKSENRYSTLETNMQPFILNPIIKSTIHITKGLVFLKVDQSTILISFSNGHKLIDQKYIVKNFGLSTARSFFEKNKLKGFKHLEFLDGNLVTELSSSNFISESKQDGDSNPKLIKSLDGSTKLSIKNLNIYLKGTDSLHFKGKFSLNDDFLGIISEFISNYNKKSDIITWPNEIQKISNRKLTSKLTLKLANKINRMIGSLKHNEISESHLKNIGLNIDILDEDKIESFKISKINSTRKAQSYIDSQQEYSKLCIYLSSKNLYKAKEILDEIKKIRIEIIYFESGFEFKKNLNFFSLISFECTMDDIQYFLINGQWYSLDKLYCLQLKETIDRIPFEPCWSKDITSKIIFPKFKKNHLEKYTEKSTKKKKYRLSEGAYNKALYRRNNHDFKTIKILNLDKTKYIPKYTSVSGNVEPADVAGYSVESNYLTLIHVKRSYSSEPFSHLISQTRNSSILLKNDIQFLKHLNNDFHSNFEDISQYNIVMACIVPSKKIKKKNSELFPILSIISIVNLYHQIENMGMKFYLVKIDNIINFN